MDLFLSVNSLDSAKAAQKLKPTALVANNLIPDSKGDVSPVSGLLAYGNANELSLETARDLLSDNSSTEIYSSVCIQDPFTLMEPYLKNLQEIGVVGIINFPSIALYNLLFRQGLETGGLDFSREAQVLREAQSLGLKTLSLITSPEEFDQIADLESNYFIAFSGLTQNGGKKSIQEYRLLLEHMEKALPAGADSAGILLGGWITDESEECTKIISEYSHCSGLFDFFRPENAQKINSLQGMQTV